MTILDILNLARFYRDAIGESTTKDQDIILEARAELAWKHVRRHVMVGSPNAESGAQ